MEKKMNAEEAVIPDMKISANTLMPDHRLVMSYAPDVETQCVHPMLPFYQPSSGGNTFSIDDLSSLVNGDFDNLLQFSKDIGIIAKFQHCANCGQNMRCFFDKSKNCHWWICTRTNNGVKCNTTKYGKFSIRKEIFLDHSHISIENVLWYVWHFVHQLIVKQCREYMSVGKFNKHTIVEAYKSCRNICNDWIRKNFEPLGGYGKIVELDESYFAGQPKYGRGRAVAWKEDDPWVFGIVERDSLDCWVQQVHNRRRTTLVPILDSHVANGSILCSDKWSAYKDLEEHLRVEDSQHYTVNHSKNFVDPETGAYTQTVEGMWRHIKAFLPDFGKQPQYLDSYLGTFMWLRYAKQRKLDPFIFFLECAAEMNPPFRTSFQPATLPSAKMSRKKLPGDKETKYIDENLNPNIHVNKKIRTSEKNQSAEKKNVVLDGKLHADTVIDLTKTPESSNDEIIDF